MPALRVFYRSALLLLVLSGGLLISPFIHRGHLTPDSIAARITGRWHRAVARAIGIRIVVEGRPCKAPALFVANHISWFDITALGAIAPLRFLSKAEVRSWPLVGALASRAGTLYIERGNHRASAEANAHMQQALQEGENVCLFPEGTTTDGRLRKFHSRLLQCAIDAGCPVQPVVLHYPPETTDGEQLTHPAALFTGNTTMAQSLLRILGAKHMSVHITLLPVISSTGQSRHQLAQQAQQAIISALPLSETSF